MTWSIEFSEEVAEWYTALSDAGAASADRVIELLVQQGNMLRMPHSRSLGEGLFELRFACEGVDRRITYAFEPRRHVITLTTFRKQRNNEAREVRRARKNLKDRWDEMRSRSHGG